jgi:peroxiredoxin
MVLRRLSGVALCLAAFAAMAAAANVPRKSPEFAINMVDGSQILISQQHGKVVVLAFILTTCPHCQHTIGILRDVQQQYGPRGLQVLASATEDMAKMLVPDFVKKFQPPFPVGYNYRDGVVEYLEHPPMLNMWLPNLVFIDRQGVIRAQYAGNDPFFGDDQDKNIRAEVEKLLKEGAASGAAPRRKAAPSSAKR